MRILVLSVAECGYRSTANQGFSDFKKIEFKNHGKLPALQGFHDRDQLS
jgi:hypothetical protein